MLEKITCIISISALCISIFNLIMVLTVWKKVIENKVSKRESTGRPIRDINKGKMNRHNITCMMIYGKV